MRPPPWLEESKHASRHGKLKKPPQIRTNQQLDGYCGPGGERGTMGWTRTASVVGVVPRQAIRDGNQHRRRDLSGGRSATLGSYQKPGAVYESRSYRRKTGPDNIN